MLADKVAAATAVSVAAAPVSPSPVASNVAASVPVVATSSPVASLPVADTPTATPPPIVVKKHAKAPLLPPPPEPEPGLFDGLPPYLPYAGGLLALLGLVGLYISKKRKNKKAYPQDSIITNPGSMVNSLFGSTGGQNVDTNNSVFNSNFAPSASLLDANEVDPVAEADVYIAYGRDVQAEEILKEALRTQPDRLAVRLKLLEIYSVRKDVRAFETIASELYGMTGGAGADWAHAASMGIVLDPDNPLYAGGKSAPKVMPMSMMTRPLENLDPEALLGNSLSQDMLDSIAAPSISTHSSILTDTHEELMSTTKPYSSLDFDLGLSSSVMNAPKPPEVAVVDKKIEPDFLSEAKPSVVTPPVIAPLSEPIVAHDELDFAALDFDFDLPVDKVAPAQSESVHEEEAVHIPEQAAVSPPPAFAFDLSSIDLDLPKAAPLDLSEEELDGHSDSEMATKLDLAIAYQEIGDKDGARELLDEVIKSGNRDQIERAKTMLLELA